MGAAHAKAILLGEHAVVYGAPAIAIPVDELVTEVVIEPSTGGLWVDSDLYSGTVASAPSRLLPVTAAIRASFARTQSLLSAASAPPVAREDADASEDLDVRVRIRSTIPHERGLGSSAAVAAAIARAVFDATGTRMDDDTLFALIQTSERAAHGNPSGIDARTVTSPVPIRFDQGAVSPIAVGAPLTLAFADSGTSGSTTQAVGAVRALRDREPARTEALLSRLAQIAEGAITDLEVGDRDAIGARMSEAHGILHRVGVSSERLDALVDAAHAAGSAGAKLTGGGLGGCVIAVADSPAHADALGGALRRAGAQNTWTVEVPAA